MSNQFDTEQEPLEIEQLAQLAENLVYRLPGCADIMIRKTITEVYRDFCARSCALTSVRRFKLTPDESRVAVYARYGGSVDCVSFVRYNGRILQEGFNYRIESESSPVVCFSRGLVPADGTSDFNLPRVEIGIVERPSLGGESAPKFILDKYSDALCEGVLAILCSMTGRAWSDMAVATSASIRYENAVCEARMKYHAGGISTSGKMAHGVDMSEMI